MKVKDCYKDGICPDCSEDIAEDMTDGGECANCGHVFWLEYPDMDRYDGGMSFI